MINKVLYPVNVLDFPLRIILAGWLLRRITPRDTSQEDIGTITPELMYICQYEAVKSIVSDREKPENRLQRFVLNYLDRYLRQQKEISDLLPGVTIVTVPRSKE